jgi:hypothetical protein
VTSSPLAAGGFGVWSRPLDPSVENSQLELFSGASTLPIRRVRTTGYTVSDALPTLADSASTPVLIWSRVTYRGPGQAADLYLTKFVAGAWQAPRAFATAGEVSWTPDMRIIGGRTFVTWERDGFVWVASNASGSFTSHMFNTGGRHPTVAASTSSGAVDHVFVTWTALGQERVSFPESASSGTVHGQWDGTYVGPWVTEVVAAGGAATKGTSVYHSSSEVVSRTPA